MKWTTQPIACLALLVLAVGCSTVKQPTATFRSADLTGITAQGFTMNFGMNLQNPNPVALPLSQTEYKLGIGGVNVLEGKANPGGTIPANGELPVTLPVTITFENLLAAEKALAGSGGKVPYALTGDIALGEDTAAGRLLGKSASVPLKYEGTLDLRELLKDPQVLLRSPAARRLAQQALGSIMSQ